MFIYTYAKKTTLGTKNDFITNLLQKVSLSFSRFKFGSFKNTLSFYSPKQKKKTTSEKDRFIRQINEPSNELCQNWWLKARFKKCEELPHDKMNFSHFLPKIQETENCANKADEETAINDIIKH